MALNKPAVVTVCETWLNDDIPNALICPVDYQCLRKDRIDTRGGGVALFVRSDFSVVHVDTARDVELVCADISLGSLNARVIVCYRPPRYTVDDFDMFAKLIGVCKGLCHTTRDIVMLGDFNLPSINWECYSQHPPTCRFGSLFLDFIFEQGFSQYVCEATRGDNVLDLVLTNSVGLIASLDVACPFSTSDHNTINFSLNNLPSANTCSDEFFYDFKRADFGSIVDYMSRINWDYEFSFHFSVQQWWDLFVSHLGTSFQLFVPLVKKTVDVPRNSIKYPRQIRLLLNKKARLWKRWHVSKLASDKVIYDHFAAKCKNYLHEYHRGTEQELIKANNLGKFYRYIRLKTKSKSSNSPIIDRDNNNALVTDKLLQANIFNKYFASVMTVDNGHTPATPPKTNKLTSLSSITFSLHKLLKCLES